MNMETFTGDARSFHDETPTKFEYQILDVNFGTAEMPPFEYAEYVDDEGVVHIKVLDSPIVYNDDWREVRVPVGTPGARDPDTKRTIGRDLA